MTMVEASSMIGADKVYLHKAPTYAATADRIIYGDVIVVHNDIDVLLVSCSQEIDIALRVACANAGFVAAEQVLEEAATIQRGGTTLDWISEMNSERNNPAQLGHISAGVTVDWGLHDGQTMYAIMLSTELGATATLPPSSSILREPGYNVHRDMCMSRLSKHEARHFARRRMMARVSPHVMLPALRLTSSPCMGDESAIAATEFEGLCRSAASDISMRYFSTCPGVRALRAVQDSLRWAEDQWPLYNNVFPEKAKTCPFLGGTDYLYMKGSISQQGTKGWHDDGNGPACMTMWQNLGTVPGREVELVVAIHGCHVTIGAGMGKFAHFMAWLPHRTQLHGPDGRAHEDKGALRLHHTAYTKMGTEYAAATLSEYKRRRLPLQVYATR